MDSQFKKTQELVDGECNDFWYKNRIKNWDKVSAIASLPIQDFAVCTKSQHQLIFGSDYNDREDNNREGNNREDNRPYA